MQYFSGHVPLFILIKNHFVLALADNGCLMCSSSPSDVTWGELSLPRLPSLIQLLNQRKWQHANSVGPEPCNLNLHTVSASLSVTRKEKTNLFITGKSPHSLFLMPLYFSSIYIIIRPWTTLPCHACHCFHPPADITHRHKEFTWSLSDGCHSDFHSTLHVGMRPTLDFKHF